MKAWVLPLLLATVTLPDRAADLPSGGPRFGPSPPIVQPGPPELPIEPDRWLPWRLFTWRDGLRPSNTALAQDADGYMWAADGPSRYNGRAWQPIDVPGKPEVMDVWSLLASRDGSLWLGRLNGGLLCIRKGVWSRHAPGSDLPTGLVSSLVEDERGTVWAGTVTGAAACHGDRCAKVEALRGANVRSLALTRAEDGRPALWVGTNHGLLRLDGIDGPSPTLSSLFADLTALPNLSIRSLAETLSPEGTRTLWIATDGGVASLRAGRWTRYDALSGFPAGPIVKLVASRSKQGRPIVWAGSFRAGLIRFEEDGRWKVYDTGSGLPVNLVSNLLLTPGGAGEEPTLWATTPAGLARLEREYWHAVDSRAGLPNDVVIGLGEARFPDGLRTHWIGTVGGMVRLTRRGWERFGISPTEPIVAKAVVDAHEEDGTPAFWIGSVDGLHRFAHGTWATFTTHNSPLPIDWIQALLAVPGARGAAVWAGTPQGVTRYEHGRWTTFQAGSSGLPGNQVRALARTPLRDGGSVVWAATDHGVGRFQGETWEKAAIPCLANTIVVSLHFAPAPDGSGWLWIGSQSGLIRLGLDSQGHPRSGACQLLSERAWPGFREALLREIQIDAWGRVYVFTDAGIYRLTLAAGPALSTTQVEFFEAGDGLPGVVFNAAAVDRLGRVWGGATGGAAVLDPAPPEPAAMLRRPAPLRLERVLVAGRERPLADGTALRYDENSVELQYALLSYRREHATRYRTQLVGLETTPSPWTAQAAAVYSRLPAGAYTFRVWGRDGEDTVAGPVEVRFRVQSAPWRSSWALGLYALALVGLGYGASQVKTLARRAATLEEQVAERTRELAAANQQLEQASLTDPLTGLSNRRVLQLNIEQDAHQAVRNALGTAVPSERNSDLLFYFLDIDHFKQLNDRAGHAAGDRVLVELAGRLREVARNTDAVVRWGGEEFLVLSRWGDRRSGEVLAERLLEAVAGKPFAAESDTGLAVTCSIGWAPYPWRPEAPEAVHYEAVMSLADKALYLAKREGRNRAVGVLPGPDGALFPDGALEGNLGTSVELVRSLGPARAEAVPGDEPRPARGGSRRPS